MHQTKKVATPSAQTFLQPSAPIKSVRHPAIAARPHQPQHAPADPDTTHLLDPNSGPTAAPADDTRHRFRSRPVPAAPARTGSEHPPRARRRRRAQPRRWPALRFAADIRTEDPAPRFAATRKHPHSAAARKHPALGPQRSNRADCSGCSGRTDRSCRPLHSAPPFPSSHPNRAIPETRRPETSPGPRLPAAESCFTPRFPFFTRPDPANATRVPLTPRRYRSEAPAATRHKFPQPSETPLAPPLHHPPGPRKRSTTPVDTAASPLGSPRGNPAQVPATVRPKSPRQPARMTLRRPPGPRASIFFFAAAIPSAQGPKPLSEHFPHPERSAFTAVLLLFMDYFFIFASIGK